MTPNLRRLVILAQFDPNGGIPPHVELHLKGLRPVASRLVLVSNSPLTPEAREIGETLCDQIIERPNIGWDFAAWRDALAEHEMQVWDEVVLTNSSIIGPLWPLEAVFERMKLRDLDFWGMVYSKQLRPHLQSFFLSFSRQVIISNIWKEYWEGVYDYSDKKKVIREYELRLTKHFSDAGFRFGHLIENKPFPQSFGIVRKAPLKRSYKVPYNVNYSNRSLERFEELIREGMPYLKASLIWGPDRFRFSSIKAIDAIDKVSFPWHKLGLEADD